MACTDYRPDHNGECLTCDEPSWEHTGAGVEALLPMTVQEARAYLAAGTAGRGPFNQTVLIVTLDSMFWCCAARYERLGPWHFIWTEHHGFFLEHNDEVQKLHVVENAPKDS